MHELRAAWRSLQRSKAFALVAVVTLALGIASTSATFSVVDAIVLRGLPYKDSSRLYSLFERSNEDRYRLPSYPQFADYIAQTPAITEAVEGLAFIRGDGVAIPNGEELERHIAAYVTPGFFQVMGGSATLGRTFAPDEEKLGGQRVAVISWDYFQTRYGGDVTTIGRTMLVDSMPTTIVGVMPRAFAFPNFAGGSGWVPPTLWQPISLFQATHTQLNLRGLHADSRTIVRIASNADSTRAAAALGTIVNRLETEYAAENRGWRSVALRPLSADLYGDLRSSITTVASAIALVLLLACANVANLMLVRGGVRAREMAVRLALGASRWRLARQLLAESLILSVAAGALGLWWAAMLVQLLGRVAAGRLPFANEMHLDMRMTAFALIASTLTGLLVGLIPAAQAGARGLVQRMRSGSAGAGTARRERMLRQGLISVQVALAVTLLIGAGLLLQSFRRMASVAMGYDPEGVIDVAIGLPSPKYDKPQDAAALYARVIEGLRALPGMATTASAGGALLRTTVATSRTAGADRLPSAFYHPVSTEYMATMRFPLLEGRWFTDEDMRSAQGLVINERLARQLVGQGSAIGTHITVKRQSQARADFGQPITLPVIGVVGNVRQSGPMEEPEPEVFLPYTLEVWPWQQFVMRASNPERLLPAIQAAIRNVEPRVNFMGQPSVRRGGAGAIDSERRFLTFVLAGFAVSALFLAAVGLYSIVSYGVVQRTREIGVRIALGAQRRNVVSLVLRESTVFVILGAIFGVVGALLSKRVVQSLLFETAPTDVTTLLAVPLVLGIAAAAATYLPARRATRLSPVAALRAE
jgi:putative ABC transport system permease protein